MAIIRKKAVQKRRVQAVREPSIIREMGDANFGDLGPLKDGQIVSYDSTTNKFVLITADELLTVSAEDQDISDEFVTQLEQELNLTNVITNVDGGGF